LDLRQKVSQRRKTKKKKENSRSISTGCLPYSVPPFFSLSRGEKDSGRGKRGRKNPPFQKFTQTGGNSGEKKKERKPPTSLQQAHPKGGGGRERKKKKGKKKEREAIILGPAKPD